MYDCVTDEIRELLLRKLPVAGTCATAIPGLILLRGDKGSKTVRDAARFSVVVIVQGNKEHLAEHNAHILYAEHNRPQTRQESRCGATDTTKPFLACSLRISSYILSLLHPDSSGVSSRNRDSAIPASSAEAVSMDLLNCFRRLLSLLDKPEQIYIRAPIIICEIHSLLLLGKRWHCFEPPAHECRHCASRRPLFPVARRRLALTGETALRQADYRHKEHDAHLQKNS